MLAFRTLALLRLPASLTSVAKTADWSQFRGPGGSGVADGEAAASNSGRTRT